MFHPHIILTTKNIFQVHTFCAAPCKAAAKLHRHRKVFIALFNVNLDHKTSHIGHFFENDVYTSSDS